MALPSSAWLAAGFHQHQEPHEIQQEMRMEGHGLPGEDEVE